MDFQKLIAKIAKTLDGLNIPYAVTGGYAVSIWGRLRATFDIDTIIELPESKKTLLIKALRKISKTGFIDDDMVSQAIERKDEFQFIHVESGIKIDFWVLGDDEFSLSKIKRRKAKIIEGGKIYFLSPEDLILSKLLWYKESVSTRHLEDAASILRISKTKIDKAYLKKWAEKLHVSKILNELKKNTKL